MFFLRLFDFLFKIIIKIRNQKFNFAPMSVFRKSIIRLFVVGFILCHFTSAYSQNDTLQAPPGSEQVIDTSEYLPYLYEGALDYNLIIASSRGYAGEIDRLVAMGADVNTESDQKATPLIFAVSNNNLYAVRALLKYNPDVNKITTEYETPLIIAVKNDNFEICETLLRAGADIDLSDRNGASPLQIACINGFFDIADLLLYYDASVDQKSDEGITPLLASVVSGYLDVADLLIQNGADIETRNNQGYTPFLMASLIGDTVMMDFLFTHGASLYATDNADYSALDLAISADRKEAVSYLLRIGADWAGPGSNAVNPYLVASRYSGRKEIVVMLEKNHIPGKIKNRIDQISISVSSRFTLKDYYTGISFSLREPYINAGIIAGCDMKLWDTRVLVKNSEHVYYQYLDKGYLIYTGVFKDFRLYENPFKSSLTLSASLLAGYSFGHTLEGTLLAPRDKFQVIPDITMRWAGKHMGLYTGLEYINSSFYKIGPVWMRVGLLYTIYFDRNRSNVKAVKWY